MSDTSTGAARPPAASALEIARIAWGARARDPQRALELARAALQERPSGAISGLALAVVAVANANLNEPEEALAAAIQVPQLLAEGADGELADAAEVLIETKLAVLRAAFLLDDLADGARAGEEALQLARLHGHAELEARAHTQLGALFGSRELSGPALKHMRAGLAILEANELPVPAVLLNNLGNIYLDEGRGEEALGFYARARERFVADADRFRSSLARSNEGRALVRLGRVAEGVTALEEAVAWQAGLANRSYLATSLARTAAGHAQAGNRAMAERRFDEALAAVASLGPTHPFEDEVRSQYGDFLLETGRREEALAQYELALERARAAGKNGAAADMLERSALALGELGRFEEAYGRLREHFEAKSRLDEASGDLLVRLQLLELESTISEGHELNVVARQAMLDANRELRERARELEDLSVTDDLTRLFNRRYFRLRLAEEESLATDLEHDLVLMLIDLDHFKSVNDRFSHSVGDRVLAEFADLLRHTFRETDVVARWGGEEFAVLLPGFSRNAAEVVAERTRSMVEGHEWEEFGEGLALTVSIGIAGLAELVPLAPAKARGERSGALLDLADSRLYEAKRLGRNRVVW